MTLSEERFDAVSYLISGLVFWRSMGDMASSLFALGLHEQAANENTQNVPFFLAELRKACFARIYAGDKELAIFLGRPPRVIGEYCVFQAPEWSNLPWDHYAYDSSSQAPRQADSWTTAAINYTADTRRLVLFARLKEEIMKLLRDRQRASKARAARQVGRHLPTASLLFADIVSSELRHKIHQQWEELPTHFRLSTSLRDCRQQSPFERDFLAGTRLDYLHTVFLLELSLQQKVSEPDESIVSTAAEMLSLVVELIILRDSVANSGSSLVWKVCRTHRS